MFINWKFYLTKWKSSRTLWTKKFCWAAEEFHSHNVLMTLENGEMLKWRRVKEANW